MRRQTGERRPLAGSQGTFHIARSCVSNWIPSHISFFFCEKPKMCASKYAPAQEWVWSEVMFGFLFCMDHDAIFGFLRSQCTCNYLHEQLCGESSSFCGMRSVNGQARTTRHHTRTGIPHLFLFTFALQKCLCYSLCTLHTRSHICPCIFFHIAFLPMTAGRGNSFWQQILCSTTQQGPTSHLTQALLPPITTVKGKQGMTGPLKPTSHFSPWSEGRD